MAVCMGLATHAAVHNPASQPGSQIRPRATEKRKSDEEGGVADQKDDEKRTEYSHD
jgi:hypothetical protein